MALAKLGTSEARRALPRLVAAAARRVKPSRSLLDNAVEIGPYRRPGAVLVPEVDAKAHAEREQALAKRVEELEDELDDLTLGLVVAERLRTYEPGESRPVEEVARELGFGDLVDSA